MVVKYFCVGIQVHVFTSINIWLLIGIMSHLHSDLWNSSGIGNEQLIKFHVGIDDKVMFIYIQVHFTTFLNLGGFVFQEPHQLPSCLLPLTPPNPNLQVTRSLEEKQDVYFVLNPIAWTSVHRIQQLGQDCANTREIAGCISCVYLCEMLQTWRNLLLFLMRQSWDNWNIKQISDIEVTVFQMKRLMFYEFKWWWQYLRWDMWWKE